MLADNVSTKIMLAYWFPWCL